jgi:hypothetical protein
MQTQGGAMSTAGIPAWAILAGLGAIAATVLLIALTRKKRKT